MLLVLAAGGPLFVKESRRGVGEGLVGRGISAATNDPQIGAVIGDVSVSAEIVVTTRAVPESTTAE